MKTVFIVKLVIEGSPTLVTAKRAIDAVCLPQEGAAVDVNHMSCKVRSVTIDPYEEQIIVVCEAPQDEHDNVQTSPLKEWIESLKERGWEVK